MLHHISESVVVAVMNLLTNSRGYIPAHNHCDEELHKIQHIFHVAGSVSVLKFILRLLWHSITTILVRSGAFWVLTMQPHLFIHLY